MNRMLINATQHGELRIALVKEEKLYDLYIERLGQEQKKANVYKGKVTRIEPSLGAAFINFGAERHGFLPVKEINKIYFQSQQSIEPGTRINIQDVIKEGQEFMVQVEKEERGTKGAALTTFVSLAGSYLVLMPNNPRAGGISRRIEGQERDELRDILKQLKIPADMGVIVRTAGVNKSLEELQWDLDALLQHWQAIQEASKERAAPFLIHKESDVIIRAMRDYLSQSVAQILVDSPEIYEQIKTYIQQTKPDFADRVELYKDKTPLFSKFRIEKQIETAYQRVVNLTSGGSIVIDHTEALVSIDVNSAKATSGKGIEETAFNTNVEAAEEVARQLRLRDIGGLIVIDFIDMIATQNQSAVTNHLRGSLKYDRARVRTSNISRFGLMEMSRQRINPRLGEHVQVTCPRCDGQGVIRSINSLALSIIRLFEEEATTEKIAQLQVQLPIDLATYLLNEKHDAITAIENRHNVHILIIPNQYLKSPKYKMKRLSLSDLPRRDRQIDSYKLIETPKIETPPTEEAKKIYKQEEPAVKTMAPKKPLPAAKKNNTVVDKFLGLFKPTKPKEEETTAPTTAPTKKPYYKNRNYKGPHGSTNTRNVRRGTRGGQAAARPATNTTTANTTTANTTTTTTKPATTTKPKV